MATARREEPSCDGPCPRKMRISSEAPSLRLTVTRKTDSSYRCRLRPTSGRVAHETTDIKSRQGSECRLRECPVQAWMKMPRQNDHGEEPKSVSCDLEYPQANPNLRVERVACDRNDKGFPVELNVPRSVLVNTEIRVTWNIGQPDENVDACSADRIFGVAVDVLE